MVLEERQKQILKKVIKLYQKAGEPVGSKALVSSGHFSLSPATLRNELAVLEKEGYVVAPHTSAGRVPTEKAYKWYLETLPNKDSASLKLEKTNDLKVLARELAEMSGEAVFVAFGINDTYYTGLSNLFSKPEFQNIERVVSVSSILDHLDGVVKDLFENSKKSMEILLGEQCPFGNDFGTIYMNVGRESALLGLFGLLRMDWEKNISIMKSLLK